MPSYRAQLNIMGLRPGHAPEAVMDSAVAALAERHHVDANQLDVIAGVPRITVRYTVDDDGRPDATGIESAALMRAAVESVAVSEKLVVLRRVKGRWVVLRR
ncbi:hypothetical protein ACSYDW_16115 [Paeniglutamicibacter sp. R2-26]|uniref:hypothetical protein n=1 Tax=Paeniglutamicibacter sp. R2-26 TaxID=3144417 RepID=UPI003EE429E8